MRASILGLVVAAVAWSTSPAALANVIYELRPTSLEGGVTSASGRIVVSRESLGVGFVAGLYTYDPPTEIGGLLELMINVNGYSRGFRSSGPWQENPINFTYDFDLDYMLTGNFFLIGFETEYGGSINDFRWSSDAGQDVGCVGFVLDSPCRIRGEWVMVPEPATALLLAGGLGVLTWRRRLGGLAAATRARLHAAALSAAGPSAPCDRE